MGPTSGQRQGQAFKASRRKGYPQPESAPANGLVPPHHGSCMRKWGGGGVLCPHLQQRFLPCDSHPHFAVHGEQTDHTKEIRPRLKRSWVYESHQRLACQICQRTHSGVGHCFCGGHTWHPRTQQTNERVVRSPISRPSHQGQKDTDEGVVPHRSTGRNQTIEDSQSGLAEDHSPFKRPWAYQDVRNGLSAKRPCMSPRVHGRRRPERAR